MTPNLLVSVANHLWQSTLVIAIAYFLTLTLRRHRAQSRYWIWLAVSVKFLVPFSVLTEMGGHLHWRSRPAIVQPALSYAIVQANQPFHSTAPITRSPVQPVAPAVNWLPPVLYGIWAIGSGTLLLSWWRRWRVLHAALRSASPADLRIEIPAMMSPAFSEPGVFGVFGPVLLLPEGITDRLVPPELRAIVAHEMCHVRRRDNLATAIHMAVEALFWFHPMVWWIGAQLMEERERACDEEVLLGNHTPEAYASGILKVCELCMEPAFECVAGVGGANLKKRIEEIMTLGIGRKLSFSQQAALCASAAAVLAAPIVIGALAAPAVQAQSPAPPAAKFSVASVKPCKAGGGRRMGVGDSSPGRIYTGCVPLVDENNLGLIQRSYVRFAGGHGNPAFGVVPIKGGPDWIHTETFEIEARADGAPSSEMMAGPMMQALLEERFHLRIRREAQDSPVYALTAANSKSRLKPFQEGSCLRAPLLNTPPPPPPQGQRYCRALIGGLAPEIIAEGSTLAEFAKLLSLVLDRPVVDRSGFEGRFDIHLEFARDDNLTLRPFAYFLPGTPPPPPGAPAATADSTKPTIFTAIQEHLGLKLTPSRGPVEVLVIDHIERPTEN